MRKKVSLLAMLLAVMWSEQVDLNMLTCSELLKEPHARAEELVGAAQVAQVGPTEGDKQPHTPQVGLQAGLCQSSPYDQVACIPYVTPDFASIAV